MNIHNPITVLRMLFGRTRGEIARRVDRTYNQVRMYEQEHSLIPPKIREVIEFELTHSLKKYKEDPDVPDWFYEAAARAIDELDWNTRNKPRRYSEDVEKAMKWLREQLKKPRAIDSLLAHSPFPKSVIIRAASIIGVEKRLSGFGKHKISTWTIPGHTTMVRRNRK